jgi:hypothetical protein
VEGWNLNNRTFLFLAFAVDTSLVAAQRLQWSQRHRITQRALQDVESASEPQWKIFPIPTSPPARRTG